MRRPGVILVLLLLALAGAAALRLVLGGLDGEPEVLHEVLALRGVRIGAGACVGAALGVAGVLLQSLLRNPLASPDLLGLGSGAGLGVMLSAYAAYRGGEGLARLAHLGFQTPMAILGAGAALGTVYLLSQRRGLLDPVALVLVGVIVALICAAGTELVRHLMPDQGLEASRLLLGAIREDVSGAQLGAMGVLVLACVGASTLAGRAMDAAALGDDEARSVGVNVGGLRALAFVLAGVLSAAAVVLAGPIGFVGLVAPHVVRLLAGPSHRTLIVGSALAGAALVLLADSGVAGLRALGFAGGRPPLSVLTSLVGGPVFIGLLRRRQRGSL